MPRPDGVSIRFGHAPKCCLARSAELGKLSEMPDAPTPLAASAAGILAALRHEADCHAADLSLGSGPVAALHALILACLARLLTSLGDLLDLWRAGQLPPPQPANPTGLRQAGSTPLPAAPHPGRSAVCGTPSTAWPGPAPRPMRGLENTIGTGASNPRESVQHQNAKVRQAPWRTWRLASAPLALNPSRRASSRIPRRPLCHDPPAPVFPNAGRAGRLIAS